MKNWNEPALSGASNTSCKSARRLARVLALHLAILLASTTAIADPATETVALNQEAVSASGEGVVNGLMTAGGNLFIVYHSGTFENPANCGQRNVYHFDHYEYPEADVSKLFSVLLSAHVSQTPVTIFVDEDECSAWNGALIRRAQIGRPM